MSAYPHPSRCSGLRCRMPMFHQRGLVSMHHRRRSAMAVIRSFRVCDHRVVDQGVGGYAHDSVPVAWKPFQDCFPLHRKDGGPCIAAPLTWPTFEEKGLDRNLCLWNVELPTSTLASYNEYTAVKRLVKPAVYWRGTQESRSPDLCQVGERDGRLERSFFFSPQPTGAL